MDEFGITTRDQKVEIVFTGLRGSGLDTSFGLHGVEDTWLQSGLVWLQNCCCVLTNDGEGS